MCTVWGKSATSLSDEAGALRLEGGTTADAASFRTESSTILQVILYPKESVTTRCAPTTTEVVAVADR